MARKLTQPRWDFEAWMRDTIGLSLEAAGLWSRMLVLMNRSPRRGYLLTQAGKPLTLDQLASNTGSSTDSVSHLLRELEDAGVYSIAAGDLVLCRRMVREEQRRATNTANGVKGGNPSLMKSVNRNSTEAQPNDQPGGLRGDPHTEFDLYLKPEEILPFRSESFVAALKDWLNHKKERRDKKYTSTGWKKCLTKLGKMGEQNAIAAIEHSVASNYAGIFEPSGGRTGMPRVGSGQVYDAADTSERRF